MSDNTLMYGLDRGTGKPAIMAVGDYELATVNADNLLTAVNDVVEFEPPAGYHSAILDIRGTSVQTTVIEGTIDGTNWFTVIGTSVTSFVISSVFTTYPQTVRIPMGTLTRFRVRCTAFTSGSVTVRARISPQMMPGIASSLAVDTELSAAAALSDAIANPTTGMVGAAMMDFNGSTFERFRAVESRTLFASAARTASPATTDQVNYNAVGLEVYVNVTAVTGLGVTFHIEGKDGLSLVYFPLLSSVALTTTGFRRFRIYPNLPPVANVDAQDILPRLFRVRPAHGDAASVTYSVGVDLLYG